MNTKFKIMLPYRIAKSNEEYSQDIRVLVNYIRDLGMKVFDLLESDIQDQHGRPVEHVYLLDCFGEPGKLSNIFSNSCVGHDGEIVLYT